MDRPSQRTEGAPEPSNKRQGSRFSLNPNGGEQRLISEFISQLGEEIQAPRNFDGPVKVKDIVYPDFATLIDEASKDGSIAEELADLFHQGLRAVQHRDQTLEVLQAVDRDWVAETTTYRNEVLELKESAVQLKEVAVQLKEDLVHWKAKYQDLHLKASTETPRQQSPQPQSERPSTDQPKVIRLIRHFRSGQRRINPPPQKNCKPLTNGKNPLYETWERNMRARFRRDHRYFPTEQDKIDLIFLLTEGKANAVLLPRMEEGWGQIKTAEDCFQALATVFKDRRQAVPGITLTKLRFKEGVAHDFTEFV